MLENDRLKLYFLQIDLENMILTAKNIRMVSLVGITSEFRTGPRFMPAQPSGQHNDLVKENIAHIYCQVGTCRYRLIR